MVHGAQRTAHFCILSTIPVNIESLGSMIDQFSRFARKVSWLKPLFFLTAGGATLVFCYVVFIEQGIDREVLIIPSIVVLLWSLVSLLLLYVFPSVPPLPDHQAGTWERLKIRVNRGWYHLITWIFCLLSAFVVWLSVKLFVVWWVDF